jgi:hypothetical protein
MVIGETKIKLGAASGRELTFELRGKAKAIMRFYFVGDQTFALNVGPMPPISEADAKTFLDSFKIN